MSPGVTKISLSMPRTRGCKNGREAEGDGGLSDICKSGRLSEKVRGRDDDTVMMSSSSVSCRFLRMGLEESGNFDDRVVPGNISQRCQSEFLLRV